MTQKIIRIGSSAGITIPKKKLEELNLSIGDEVNYSVEAAKKPKHEQLLKEYDAFVKQYGQALKNLADR